MRPVFRSNFRNLEVTVEDFLFQRKMFNLWTHSEVMEIDTIEINQSIDTKIDFPFNRK